MAAYLKQLKKRWLPRFHRDLFSWHCQTFFPFERYLLVCDRVYLEECFQRADDYVETTSQLRHYSYYSYCHRVKGVEVNSSRLSYGSIVHPEEVWQAAQPSLQIRGIQLPPHVVSNPSLIFYGLGWDFQAEHFKVYFRFEDGKQIPLASVQRILAEVSYADVSEGLLSLTYHKNGRLEEKVYFFPRLQEGVAVSTVAPRVLMLSSEHGMMSQYDALDLREWLPRLNPQGQRIVQSYQAYGEVLRTIYIKNANHFTIQYP